MSHRLPILFEKIILFLIEKEREEQSEIPAQTFFTTSLLTIFSRFFGISFPNFNRDGRNSSHSLNKSLLVSFVVLLMYDAIYAKENSFSFVLSLTYVMPNLKLRRIFLSKLFWMI